MNPIEIISAAVIVLIIGCAIAYIVKAKKDGKKCIGCPDSSSCSGKCSCCQGCFYAEKNKNQDADK